MSDIDVSKIEIVPYVHVADASVQDYSIEDSQFPGIYNDNSFLWAMVDTEDGKRLELYRAVSKGVAFDFSVIECADNIWETPKAVKYPGEADLFHGMIMWYENDGVIGVAPLSPVAMKHPIEIFLGPKQYVWKEDNGYIDVVLTPLPNNVTTIYVPGLPDDVGYTSSGCTISGSVDGSKITGGYGGIDRMYYLPWQIAPTCKIFMLEHYWFAWGSTLDDGRWESGNVMLGAGNFAIATFQREGEDRIIATNDDVKASVDWIEKDGNKKPHAATLKFGGKTFHYQAEYNAAASAIAFAVDWLHGTVSEEGGPEPVKSYATLEIIKAHVTEQ